MVNLLISLGVNVNARDPYQNTPLHEAMKTGNPIIVQALIKAGANPLAVSALDGNTPLHLAMEKGSDAETFFKLLDTKKNAGVNLRNQKHETPFMLAAKYGHLKLIIDWLAKIDDHSNEDNNPPVAVSPENIDEAFDIALRDENGRAVALYLLGQISNIKFR